MAKPCPAYPIVRMLGSGTFGQVYLSKSPKSGRAVAVKVISTQDTFSTPVDAIKEVDLLRGLSHPNIVAFIDLLERGSRFYIIMEFCDGGDLRDVLQHAITSQTPLTEKRVGAIFVQIVLALHYCHQSLPSGRIVMHRDLKPENVLMTQAGQIKLGDFGLSTLVGQKGGQAHSFVGTPGYLAPEVIACQPYGCEADMFSLGCMLFEMLTLVLPDTRSLLKGHSVWRRTLTVVSPEVRTLTSGLLSIPAADRWSTCDVLAFRSVACWLNDRLQDGEKRQDGIMDTRDHRQEQEYQKREQALTERAVELRAQSRRLGAREAELEAKMRKFTMRASKSPSVEPTRPVTRGKGGVKRETGRKPAPC